MILEEGTGLSDILSGLPEEKDGMTVYCWMFPSSQANSRIFPESGETVFSGDVYKGEAVYDCADGSGGLYAVWIEGEGPSGWNAEQKDRAFIIASEDGIGEEEYRELFGGSEETEYGKLVFKRTVSGMSDVSYHWIMKNAGGTELYDSCDAVFQYDGAGKELNGSTVSVCMSVPAGENTDNILSEELEIRIAGRPLISDMDVKLKGGED